MTAELIDVGSKLPMDKASELDGLLDTIINELARLCYFKEPAIRV